jgi:hypothetical protein
MNKLLNTNIEYQGEPEFLYHYKARVIFKTMIQEKNIDLNTMMYINLDMPKMNKEYLTRLELAKWIYSYAIYNEIIKIPTKEDKIPTKEDKIVTKGNKTSTKEDKIVTKGNKIANYSL